MKLIPILGILSALLGPGVLSAGEDNLLKPERMTIIRPLTLDSKEMIPDQEIHHAPPPPHKNADGSPVLVEADVEHCPRGTFVDNLAAVTPDRTLRSSGPYHWMTLNGLAYCRYREGGRDWYGWTEGESFRWVLARGGRFWWRDAYAERWLHYDRGYWWWQGPKGSRPVQVYLRDGHYHECDSEGVLGEDLWTTGIEEAVSEPVEKKPAASATPGKARHGRGRGMRGGSGSPDNPGG